MTSKETAKRARAWGWEEFKRRAFAWFLGGVFGAVAWVLTPAGEAIQKFADMPDRLNVVEAKVDALDDRVASASGEDRVISEPFGMSFVEEPVTQGDQVVLHLYLQRTDLGLGCTAASVVFLFRDASNIETPGERGSRTPLQQVGSDLAHLRIRLVPPDTLVPGRITVQGQIQYRCGDKLLVEKTRPVAYRLLARI